MKGFTNRFEERFAKAQRYNISQAFKAFKGMRRRKARSILAQELCVPARLVQIPSNYATDLILARVENEKAMNRQQFVQSLKKKSWFERLVEFIRGIFSFA